MALSRVGLASRVAGGRGRGSSVVNRQRTTPQAIGFRCFRELTTAMETPTTQNTPDYFVGLNLPVNEEQLKNASGFLLIKQTSDTSQVIAEFKTREEADKFVTDRRNEGDNHPYLLNIKNTNTMVKNYRP